MKQQLKPGDQLAPFLPYLHRMTIYMQGLWEYVRKKGRTIPCKTYQQFAASGTGTGSKPKGNHCQAQGPAWRDYACLQEAQEVYGYLPVEVQTMIAEGLASLT